MHPDALERYLAAVRHELRGLPVAEVREIERELRSHVLDRTAGSLAEEKVLAALDSIGNPREIARLNLQLRADTLPAPSRTNSAKLTRGLAAFGRALLALMLSAIGYGFAACWLIAALAKPFAPDRVGLWLLPDPSGDLSVSLGRQAADVVARELLGWWIVPIGLLIGGTFAAITFRYDAALLRRFAADRDTAK